MLFIYNYRAYYGRFNNQCNIEIFFIHSLLRSSFLFCYTYTKEKVKISKYYLKVQIKKKQTIVFYK